MWLHVLSYYTRAAFFSCLHWNPVRHLPDLRVEVDAYESDRKKSKIGEWYQARVDPGACPIWWPQDSLVWKSHCSHLTLCNILIIAIGNTTAWLLEKVLWVYHIAEFRCMYVWNLCPAWILDIQWWIWVAMLEWKAGHLPNQCRLRIIRLSPCQDLSARLHRDHMLWSCHRAVVQFNRLEAVWRSKRAE